MRWTGLVVVLAAIIANIQALFTCSCYCSGSGGILNAPPYALVGGFPVGSCGACLLGGCAGYPACTADVTSGIEARCSDTASQCVDVPPDRNEYSKGYTFSTGIPGPWPSGSLVVNKCMAGTDGRTSTPLPPVMSAIYVLTCTNRQWTPSGASVKCTPCAVNTCNPIDTFERLACKP
jgi:hypothetical protein